MRPEPFSGQGSRERTSSAARGGRKARHAAALDGETAAYGELAKHADLNFNQLRAHLAWFSKYGKALKGMDKGLWPMTVTDAGSKAWRGVRYRYQMPRQIAVWWLGLDQDD